MVLYKVKITKKVRKKDLPSIPSKDVNKIVEKIKGLAQNPYPDNSIRLKGREEYRIRQGDYRILYIVEEKVVTVFVVKVGHRKNIYKA
jgi:mRNA interferase RelE/StbE